MKKGEQSIGVTIAIVIGVILLVLLVFGVTDVWGVFSGETSIWTEDNSNVDSLISICNLRCSNEDTYAYCSEAREIEIDGKEVINGSCEVFGKWGSSIGFERCSKVTCSSSIVSYNLTGSTPLQITSESDFEKVLGISQ